MYRKENIKSIHLSITVKEIQAGYLTNLYFKNIYVFQNKLPSSKATIRQVETQTEGYIPFDSLLFRIPNLHDEQNPVLCIL